MNPDLLLVLLDSDEFKVFGPDRAVKPAMQVLRERDVPGLEDQPAVAVNYRVPHRHQRFRLTLATNVTTLPVRGEVGPAGAIRGWWGVGHGDGRLRC